MNKTWRMINSLRGKGKRQIKPTFIIDNEKIINRRVIANEFNKYFVSLATNLNKAYNELGELSIDNLPSFTDYLPIYLVFTLVIVRQKKSRRFKRASQVTYPYMWSKNLL